MKRRKLLTSVVAIMAAGCLEGNGQKSDKTRTTEPRETPTETLTEEKETPPPTGDAELDDLILKNDTRYALSGVITAEPHEQDQESFDAEFNLDGQSQERWADVPAMSSSCLIRIETDDIDSEYEWEGTADSLVARITEDRIDYTEYVS